MPYDLFISYSRKDNQQGRITALKEQIEVDYRNFAKEDLRCFFDLEDIATMDDWQHRILEGLRDSNLLLLVLSPAYLNSPYCEWEIVEFLKYEHSRSVGGQGVTPVYFVEIPELKDPDFEQRAAAWIAQVRRRNRVDLRPWFHEGAEAMKRADVRQRLDDLERSLHARLSKLRRLRDAPGNLPAHNPYFVGREAEMQRLHESAGLGRFGVLTAIQGMGGLGKTALAIQYAYAYADFYPGGRWLVGCAGENSLASVLRRLDTDIGITFNEEEKRDDNHAARRVLAELEARARSGAEARAREKDPPEPRALLLLDNVDVPNLLQPPQSDLISGKRWLHVLATTRLGGDNFGHDSERQTILAVDELPLEDAVRLIESHQPDGRFPSEEERAAAIDIAKLLGGFTLAVEVVAVHLSERQGQITCAAFLERLRREGLAGLEGAAKATKRAVNHQQKLISATLAPTLDLLSPKESLVLAYAALLPPDTIPLPWLRVLVAKNHHALGKDSEPGYDDPWLSLVNHLFNLRLFQVVDIAPDTHAPRLVRMHRVVGEFLSQIDYDAKVHRPGLIGRLVHRVCSLVRSQRKTRRVSAIMKLAKLRCRFLKGTGWLEKGNHWELTPLASLCLDLLRQRNERGEAIASTVAPLLKELARLGEAESLYRASLAFWNDRRPWWDRDYAMANILSVSNNLAGVLADKGNYREAERLYRSVLEREEGLSGEDHPNTLASMGNLAALLYQMRQYDEAESLARRAWVIKERTLGSDDPSTLASKNNMALIIGRKGDASEEAELLFRQVREAKERVLGPDHPETFQIAINHAEALAAIAKIDEAEALYRRTKTGLERVLGLDHPTTALSMEGLAGLLLKKQAYVEAEQLQRQALEIRRTVLGPEHPMTLTAMKTLALIVNARGDSNGANELYRLALEGENRSKQVKPVVPGRPVGVKIEEDGRTTITYDPNC